MLKYDYLYYLSKKRLLEKVFREKQQQYVINDLVKCNKTAWILPEYFAQLYSRNLKMLVKHSDIRISSFNNPYFMFRLRGVVPTSLSKRASLIKSSGLLEWRPNFINGTEKVMPYSLKPPTKPNMSGNIQFIFEILGTGLTVAQFLFTVELENLMLILLKSSCKTILQRSRMKLRKLKLSKLNLRIHLRSFRKFEAATYRLKLQHKY